MRGLLIIGLLAAVYLSRKSKAANKLDYFVKSVDVSKGKISLVLEIINPTYTKLTVDSINLKLQSENLSLGRIDYFETFDINPRSKRFINLPVEIQTGFDLGTFIVKLVKGEISEVTVKGTILSMGFSSDIEKTLTLK